jgi:hypothetical protein
VPLCRPAIVSLSTGLSDLPNVLTQQRELVAKRGRTLCQCPANTKLRFAKTIFTNLLAGLEPSPQMVGNLGEIGRIANPFGVIALNFYRLNI